MEKDKKDLEIAAHVEKAGRHAMIEKFIIPMTFIFGIWEGSQP